MYSETLVYTPGSRGRAQPTPDETTPTTIMLPSARLPIIKGPPLSAYEKIQLHLHMSTGNTKFLSSQFHSMKSG